MSTPMRVLLVEDEELIGRMVEVNLQRSGYEVSWAKAGDAGLARALAEPFDALVLDVMLPGRNGFEVLEALRKAERTTPVLLLTAREDMTSKVRGFESGADDYLVKPFEMAELLARVRALIRRSQGERHVPSTRLVQFDKYEVNVETREAVTNQGRVTLSEKEAKTLALLFRQQGEVVTRASILEEAWGMDAFPTERTVDNLIVRLRRYFEPDPDQPLHIVSVRGQGYRFSP